MADNITLNSMSGGAVVATDDAGAAGHVQVVKLAISTDGSATVIPADATNGLKVDVARLPDKGATIAASNVSVGTTETSLASASASRLSVGLYNNGSATVFVGPTGVTTSTGFPIPAGGALFLDQGATAQVFGIVASGTVNVRVITESD